ALARSHGAAGSRRGIRPDPRPALGHSDPRPRRLRLRGRGRGGAERTGRPGVRPPGGLRAGQSRGRLPDPRARYLAGQDGVHRALLRAPVERDRQARGPAGQAVAFVDPASSSGYIYPMVLLIKRGLVKNRDPKTFFKDALFAGNHETALQSLVHGRVDAAASFDKAPELYLKDKAAIAELSVVGETPEIPEAAHCLRPGA